MKSWKTRRKTFLLMAMLMCSGMASAQVLVKGNVYGGGELGTVTMDAKVTVNGTANGDTIRGSLYGGGKGDLTDETSGLVKGNTTVTMTGGVVERSIYGGGELGSVGTFTTDSTVIYTNAPNVGVTVPFPTACADGTGLATVTVTGGSVGRKGSLMPWNSHDPADDDRGWIFCGGAGEIDSINYPKAIAMAVVNATHLEISGSALVTASVYGGCENGLVLDSTFVEIKGGQIGTGLKEKQPSSGGVLVGTFADPYPEAWWTTAINAVKDGTIGTALAEGGDLYGKFFACDTWDYGDNSTPKQYNVYDIFYGEHVDPDDPTTPLYEPEFTATEGTNGQSFFGNVFGGGSGYYPMAPGIWRRSAGRVNRNTRVEITGGHILTSVYGGNENTDVLGKATLKMSGGTVGVPRTLETTLEHPIICYLYGAGKGDQRVMFNKWTNVAETDVQITGGTIFGSALGGGEDGHVLGNSKITVKEDDSETPTIIGTWGRSGYDGNLYGAGRGFSGTALTAGNVCGNVEMTIEGGLILGNVFGGGRNASVGPKLRAADDPLYGQLQPDDANGTHGHVTITITGGTIGNDYESKLHNLATINGGNVYGGSMGALLLLDGSLNTMWPRMSRVKTTNVTIKETAPSAHPTIIKGSVYGGSKFGTVAENTSVDIQGGTIWRDVYGGGYGSSLGDDYEAENKYLEDDGSITSVMVAPRRRAGRVEGNAKVSMSDGWVKRNVYGGGELSSVGTITNEIVVQSESDSLSIGWPVRLFYKENTGADTVLITGGRIGITGNDFMGPWAKFGEVWKPAYYTDEFTSNEEAHELTGSALADSCTVNGEVYGGGKGEAGERHEMAELSDCVKTVVTVNYSATDPNTATASNFKPTNGFVSDFHSTYGDWSYATKGCIVSSLYGAAENGHTRDSTYVTLKNGLIGGNLYGGGKGTDMYLDSLLVITYATNPGEVNDTSWHYNIPVHSITAGKVFGNTYVTMNGGHVLGNVYGGGELASVGKGNYLGYGEKTGTQATADSANFVLTSGKCFVTINGGTIGTETWNHNGNVFGSSKGLTFTNVTATPRYNYSRDFFLGYANFTYVNIGHRDSIQGNHQGPRIYGSVFGGGENGHVRFDTEVTINKGEIGEAYANITSGDEERMYRGNVYGAGQGIDKIEGTDNYCNSAGSVTLNTKVTVNGGTIHRNIYGGGSLASVGPPPTGYNPGTSLNEVTIKGGTIGEVVHISGTTYDNYGGDIFGGCRGILDNHAPLAQFATASNTRVTLDTLRIGTVVADSANVIGDVYGGGEVGQVKQNAVVNVNAGTVGRIGYTWKHANTSHTVYDSIYHKTGGSVYGGGKGDLTKRDAALVSGNTEVNISGGHVQYSVYGGGELASVGLRDSLYVDPNASPKVLKDFKPRADIHGNDSTGFAKVTVTGGQVGPAPAFIKKHLSSVDSIVVPIGLNGTDGYVFGGGKGIGDDQINSNLPFLVTYYDFADVNNSEVIVNMPMPRPDHPQDSIKNRLWGSVFGGAEDGHVLGNAKVKYISGLMGTYGTTSYDGNIFGGGRNYAKKNYSAGRVRGNDTVTMCGGTILGSIFGGGRLALTGCGLSGFAPVRVEGNDVIYSDMLEGDDHGNIFVKVNGGTIGNERVIDTFLTHPMGDVYGGGKGTLDSLNVAYHPKAASLLLSGAKNTTVIIADSIDDGGNFVSRPIILGSVFGGGEVANVGQHEWKMKQYTSSTETIGDIVLVEGSGKATVTVSGGTIGATKAQMRVQMAEGAGNYNLYYNDDRGHVFGGGEGKTDNPNDRSKYAIINPASGTAGVYNNKSLLDLMASVGETEVTVSDTAFVKGAVYGGGMNGHVLGNAKVTVSGGQIGAGYYVINGKQVDSLYANDKFFNPVTYFGTNTTATDIAGDVALHGCVRWDYVANNQKPFDPIALKADPVANKPTNGETWFGHVFGGGSGYYPYIVRNHANTADSCVWNPDAGKVYGHTEVEITGGHILSNVYGGCQTTDVGNYVKDGTTGQLYNNSGIAQSGKAIVTMSGGTVGVPESMSSIQAYPFTNNIYGGGQGTFRDELKALNNVDTTRVVIKEVSGTPKPIVYGMVFGGSQNGHVLDSTKVIVSGGVIGTTGLTGYDGSVFGGGQGTFYQNPGHYDTLYAHAGRVGGNTRVIMKGGTALGNLYGGGLVALTGVGVNGWFDDYVTGTTYQSDKHGLAKVELSGESSVGNYFNNGLNVLKCSQPSGNVFGGGRGKLDDYKQDDFARLANSAVIISGKPTIHGSVFGGGEMANVGYWLGYKGWYADGTAATRVTITGSPTIGTEKEFDGGGTGHYSDDPGNWTYYDTIRYVDYEAEPDYDTTYIRMLTHTRTGNVFGGGQGEVAIEGNKVFGLEQGHCGTTNVNINMNDGENGGHILGCVFGGSEEGVIWGSTEVHIAGGTIGEPDIKSDSLKYNSHNATNPWTQLGNHATYSYGSVFGGSYGKDYYESFRSLNITNPRPQMIDSVNAIAGRVYGNTLVDITGGTIRGNVFGGGDMASVGNWRDSIINGVRVDIVPDSIRNITGPYAHKILGNCTVNVSQAEGKTTVIGPLDGTGLNAYVFGGGKGFYSDPDGLRKAYSNVDSTFVTISGGKIWGSVFGGGNDAHTLGSASVIVHLGANIGEHGTTTWDGNIFGGGRNFVNSNHTNGRVSGNINIKMDGGAIQGTIFGGGRLALTGVNLNGDPYLTNTTDHVYDSDNHGLVTINVSGEYDASTYSSTNGYSTTIGNSNSHQLLYDSDESVGDIFGSGKGDTKAYDDILAGRVANTKINITGSPRIYGSVFGGGEMASIGYWYPNSNNTKTIFYGKSGSAEVTIGSSGTLSSESDNLLIGTDMEFRYDYATGTGTNAPSYWTVFDDNHRLIHSCTGNVYGGSQGDVDTLDCHWASMARSRTSTVTINSGTIMSRVFGGAEQGSLAGNATVVVNGGTIGSLANYDSSPANQYYFGGVYGGGYGSHNPIFNGTHWQSDPDEPIVNDSTDYLDDNLWTANYLAGRTYGDTRVDILGGTIQGDVFGGASFAFVGTNDDATKGNTLVNIGAAPVAPSTDPTGEATFRGNVYGANNYGGTPFGNVVTHIYKTAHVPDDEGVLGDWYPVPPHATTPTDPTELAANALIQQYAIDSVFGGSNQTDYIPLEGKNAWVYVHKCKENTVCHVYGGSNAANIGAPISSTHNYTTDVNVYIDGGRFHRIFGGGNGTQQDPANIYGMANTTIDGGLIDELFGGSDGYGDINQINLEVSEDPDCELVIGNGYGGGNESPFVGDIVAELSCGDGVYESFYGGSSHSVIYGNVTLNVSGGTVENLFGGSKGRAPGTNGPDDPGREANIRKYPSGSDIAAHLYDNTYPPALVALYQSDPTAYANNYAGTAGNVKVNLYGGIITNVFGGSDQNGNIEGKIEVNVMDKEYHPCELDVWNIFGASNDTPYTPVNLTEPSPVVNVIHIYNPSATDDRIFGIRQNVFGGGKGSTATVTSNPKVNIGYDASMASILPSNYPPTPNTLHGYPRAYVKGSVFGGGQLAQVIGNPEVKVQHANATVNMDVYGGGLGDESETYVNYGKVTGSTHVTITDGAVMQNVYGGGSVASVTGNAYVTMSDGTIGDVLYYNKRSTLDPIFSGDVYGGGQGGKYVPSKPNLALPSNADSLGRVYGNTFVTVSGGTVRHNVYGGGRLASVGTYDKDDSGNITGFTENTGKATVIINHKALIGPLKDDLVTVNGYPVSSSIRNRNFKVLGLNEGYVFGGSRGFAEPKYNNMAFVKETSVTICDTAQVVSSVFGGGENGHVFDNTNVTISSGIIGGIPLHGTEAFVADTGVYKNVSLQFSDDDSETYEDKYGVGRNIYRGNVFGGGRGIDDFVLTDSNHDTVWIIQDELEERTRNVNAGRVMGNTTVNISDSATIYNRVYGGGDLASVGTFTYYAKADDYPTDGVPLGDSIQRITYQPSTGLATVNVTGGTIGTDGKNNGDVVGGGHGRVGNPNGFDIIGNLNDGADLRARMAYVRETNVNISQAEDKTTKIMSNVYGGSMSGHVYGDTHVTVEGGTIGDTIRVDGVLKVRGGWHSNVYGGGGGGEQYSLANGKKHLSITSGRVFGNSNVEIKGGKVWHNVYGGGAIASVGTYDLRSGKTPLVANTGQATVTIKNTGSVITTIGLDGDENGMVFGSGRGEIDSVGAYMDSLSYTGNTLVTIGVQNDVTTGPKVNGSVYGSGENGHVFENAVVNVHSGIIGCTAGEYQANASNSTWVNNKFPYRGNVYGSGCGTDTYPVTVTNPNTNQTTTIQKYNPTSGVVTGNTEIHITGGLISHNVYGAGAMASVGYSHQGTYVNGSGHATINLSGGQVGLEEAVKANPAGDSGGNVFGGARGIPGGSAYILSLANLDSTRVNIKPGAYVVSSVFGGGDNGHVMRHTCVNMTGGTVGMRNTLAEFITDSLEHPKVDHIYTGSLLGGGRGTDPVTTTPLRYSDTTGCVFGNTYVTISGGTVRHAVYGGGGLSSVGTIDSIHDGLPCFKPGTGITKVTVSGGLIGPKRDDLIRPYDPLMTSADSIKYVDSTFMYLGGNAGWVFGAGCGLVGDDYDDLTFNDSTFVTISDNAQVVGAVYGGGENGHVARNTRVDVTGGTIGGVPLHGTTYTIPEGNVYYYDAEHPINLTLAAKDSEIAENEYGVGKHVFRGSVFGGGKGTDYTNAGKYSMYAGRVYGNTHVNVSGDNTKIYNRVYGGGAMASVGKFTYYNRLENIPDAGVPLTDSLQRISYESGTGDTYVTISGGTIGMGSNATDGNNQGYVVGGGRGLAGYSGNLTAEFTDEDPADQVVRMAYVNNTNVTIKGTAKVKGNVYGGPVSGHVYGDAHVKVEENAEIGYTYEVEDENGNTVVLVHGGWHSNVFGGGGGQKPYKKPGKDPHLSITAGRVYGNTKVEIMGDSKVYHNVYGGGPIASVGTYDLRLLRPAVAPNTGKTEVIITGGTIGYDGEDNGHVFGSGRGYPAPALNFLDSLSYAVETFVTIGTDGSSNNDTLIVHGSVYGSGESGHTYKKTNVNIYSGTVNHSVYGAGEGDDTYTDNNNVKKYNPIAGCVQGNTAVKMTGGLVKGNLYGGGRLASVGILLQETKNPENPQYHYPDTVVWIAQMENVDPRDYGNTKVEITGGTIGRVDVHANEPISADYPRTGFVFGGGKGMLLDPAVYKRWTDLANVSTSHVIVGGGDNNANVKSSVYGGSEDGRVLDSTWVEILSKAEIGEANEDLAFHRGNVFGGGSGNDSISVGTGVNQHYEFKREAGRVNGNARVEMTGGHVYNSVYGGCETTSVGLYGIADGTTPAGLPVGALYWIPNDKVSNGGGKATVTISGGVVGWERAANLIKNKPRYGYVYGAGKGDPRTDFNTWTNVNNAYVTVTTPITSTPETPVIDTIYGCVFGGGEEGHVLGNTCVKIEGDTLTTWIGTYGTTGADGNVFGSGRGKSPVALTAGGVGGNTRIDIEGGRMLGSIFGGGNNSSVGIYFTPATDEDHYGVMQSGTDHGYTTVNISGGTIGHHGTDANDRTGGNVYGGSRGTPGPEGSVNQKMAKVKETHVNISQTTASALKGTHIMGSVFGSGEDGHVLQDTYVTIIGGQIGGAKYGDYNPCLDPYHGNVYGGGRGLDTYKDNQGNNHYSITAGKVDGNTNVTIKGGHIVRNVYGGGNLASVGQWNTVNDQEIPVEGTGLATVTVNGGTIGWTHENQECGNVFGSSHGGVGGEFVHLAFVNQTHVTIDSTAQVYGSVFGGGEDGHVREHTLVDVQGGTVGSAGDGNLYNGNVYGGGRGISTGTSATAGEVYGHTTVNIQKSGSHNGTYYTPTIYRNVFGGGSASVVHEYKVVNISDGLVKGNVFGGSREIPTYRENKAPRWVNMWGGTIEQDLYGCSYQGIDGDPNNNQNWASFINMSGGTVMGDVYAAGFQGQVKGSVAVMIGEKAIELAPIASQNGHKPTSITKSKLNIIGNVYGGSNYYGSETAPLWHSYDITGYSHIYIDGTGYDTEHDEEHATTTPPYMNLGKGLYGCGSSCESGESGRSILIRNYGKRDNNDDGSLKEAKRKLTTIQRCNSILLDNTNIKLVGTDDISGEATNRKFAVLKVDEGFYVTNGSGIVLGESGAPSYMDSIHSVASLYLKNNNTETSYNHITLSGGLDGEANWEMVGIGDDEGDEVNTLYRIHDATNHTALLKPQENVIIFNGDSRLWVRYFDNAERKRKYGELYGFFRMRSQFTPIGTESFAYARPKLTPYVNPIVGYDTGDPEHPGDTWNKGDGGFLSYNNGYNNFTQEGQTVLGYTYPDEGNDGGSKFTRKKQYPYYNVTAISKTDNNDVDMERHRVWVLLTMEGKPWYVDGRGIGHGGWGKDANHQDGWGHFPDMPKLTITGNGTDKGIFYDESILPENYYPKFDQQKDVIFVVGPVNALLENANLNQLPNYPLMLLRYPGGHKMSNGEYDGTDLANPSQFLDTISSGYAGMNYNNGVGSSQGPGPNYGAMVLDTINTNFVMENVIVDGLYGYSGEDVTEYNIPTTSFETEVLKVNKPLVVTGKKAKLTLKGNTELKRGYNSTNADVWYTDADYVPYDASGKVTAYHGGALFVDSTAVIEVSDSVLITGNKQKIQIGTTTADAINCNVYLPTFTDSIVITDYLNKGTNIGVTSPKRNKAKLYTENTFSPVAVASTQGIAEDAWNKNVFKDDQEWFFSNSNGKDTYYRKTSGGSDKSISEKTLYFGWTWANVVRQSPDATPANPDYFKYSDIDKPEDLAWLISKTSGMNRVQRTQLSGQSISQTKDLNLKQYIWVPIGTDDLAGNFMGTYDGKGHLIDSLFIEYIGLNDNRYKRQNYGLFGVVNGNAANRGIIKRTFVVGGKIQPASVPDVTTSKGDTISRDATTYYIGGLVGRLVGVENLEGEHAIVYNSEAALNIDLTDIDDAVAGGLVGQMTDGEVHSSMAMPEIDMPASTTNSTCSYLAGGLVGNAESGMIYNSFVNAKFSVGNLEGSKLIGGLLGSNTSAEMKNCYVAIQRLSPDNANFDGIVNQGNREGIDHIYVMSGYNFTAPNSNAETFCKHFTDVIGADNLGYMYADNILYKGAGENLVKDTAMFVRLNEWVDSKNGSGHKYARWARPGLAYYETEGNPATQVLKTPINGDLPVLLLSDNSAIDVESTDDFRSMATYNKGIVLQYGGTARDGADKHLSEMLKRDEYVFVYGDVDGHDSSGGETSFDGDDALVSVNIEADKVSIYEHASIKYPGALADFANTYVGVTFDNSWGKAYATPGMNAGLEGGSIELPRDWHMFSTPLQEAPLGFNYNVFIPNNPEEPNGPGTYDNTNRDTYVANTDEGQYYNNPWVLSHHSFEFSWLNGGLQNGNKRYWMKGWTNSQITGQTFNSETWEDGYFPSSLSSLHGFGETCIEGTDESGRYPYGMDLYTWYEPEYHWINFKRNGPNHWHSDGSHKHIDYYNDPNDFLGNACKNRNEETLIKGKGYMASIAVPTYLQSHGKLNGGNETITLTYAGGNCQGWNLVGNPYHGYLDFDQLAVANTSVLATSEGGDPFYVIYNADAYNGQYGSGYRYYPKSGSKGGDYAGRYLHPHQGFFVEAKGGGALTFNESMLTPRSEVDDGAFRDERPEYPLVNLYLSSDKGCNDLTVVEFKRPEWGGANKLRELREGNGLFYGYHDGERYAALFAGEEATRVPLWFEAKEDDIFTMKWKTANADFNSLYLIDNIQGIQYDMLANDTYTFEGHKQDYYARFYIVFDVTGLEELEGSDDFVFFDGSQWVVTGDGDLDFIDMHGRILRTEHVSGQTRVTLPKVASSVYLFRLSSPQGVKLQKVVVNNY